MGMLYRRKKRDPVTGLLVEQGPFWMKYYDGGKPIYESTDKFEKRDAQIVLRRAETKVADGLREGPAVNRTRFEDLVEGLKNDYILKRRKTWKLREHHLAHLKPVFGGMRAKAITTPKLQAYVAKRLERRGSPRHGESGIGLSASHDDSRPAAYAPKGHADPPFPSTR